MSSSYIESDSDYKVIAKIEKFSFMPGEHYYLIVQDLHSGVYNVFERLTYNANTESFGYLWDNTFLDNLSIGSVIHKGDAIKTSNGFDQYHNKINGTNLLTMYMSCGQNLEDSVILSETGSAKLGSNLIENIDTITINDNDVLLNLYGDDNIYKTFPDIGEEVKNGIFCSIRRIENSNKLYSLAQNRLKDIMLSDRNITESGIVADIDVYCNNPDILKDSIYNQQLYFYHMEKQRFNKEVTDAIGPLAMNGRLSYNLKHLYVNCRNAVAGKQYFKNNQFNNVHMEVVLVRPKPMDVGDKMADRYGGKGVVSMILPDEMMPMLDNGRRIECIKNTSTCINRENLGQLHELSINFISMRILDAFKQNIFTPQEMVAIWYKYVSMVDPEEAYFGISPIDMYDEHQCRLFVDMLLESDKIIISTPAFTTPVNIDLIREIYKEFPWIEQYIIIVPIRDSNGNIRHIKARRKVVVADIYNYRLKQYAEEKFSVTSLSATNLKNLNTRSKANKMHEAKYTKTPIMFGPMESGDMGHMGFIYVVMQLMLYSSSPQGRQHFKNLLVGDPYNIDIKLDKDSKNRNAEIINALLKTMGIRLVFKKVPKTKKWLCHNVMAKYVYNNKHKPKTNIRDIMGRFDELESKYKLSIIDPTTEPMINNVMCKIVNK